MIKKFRNFEPQIHNSCFIADSAVVTGQVILGKNSSVWECAVLGDIDTITIGDNTNIQDASVLHVNNGIPLSIGNNVTVGHGVMLHGCSIGDNTLIGIGAIVLNGAKIGNNCIIGAGAVVTTNTQIPDGCMVLGTPGKVVRPLRPEEIEGNLKNADNYATLSKVYLENKI